MIFETASTAEEQTVVVPPAAKTSIASTAAPSRNECVRLIRFDSGPRVTSILIRGLRIAIAMSAVLMAYLQAYADARVAVIGSEAGGVEKIVPLVELRLGQKPGIVLLERAAIKEILREQELQALVTAEGVGKRLALGKLLKADLLVIVQGETKPTPHANVVICETKQGLRLCNQPVEFSKNMEADADAVVQLVDRSIEKQRRRIDDIVAVPPFVNNTLVFEGDHLKAACAKLIEQMLLDRPGVLVVEIAEAKAIAQEFAVTNAPAVERRLPLYLMGEYRLTGEGEQHKISFKLVLLRGIRQLDVSEGTGADEELQKLLRQAAGAMFSKALHQEVRPPDPVAEVRQLTERSRLFSRLGNWEEASALAEAGLLLKPDQIALHGDAIYYINKLVEEQLRRDGYLDYSSAPLDGPTGRLAKAMLPANLYHAEIYIRNT